MARNLDGLLSPVWQVGSKGCACASNRFDAHVIPLIILSKNRQVEIGFADFSNGIYTANQ